MRIDTLDTYEALIGSGLPDEQAKTQARLLAKAGEPEMDFNLLVEKINAKFYIVYALGAAIFAASTLPALIHYLDFHSSCPTRIERRGE